MLFTHTCRELFKQVTTTCNQYQVIAIFCEQVHKSLADSGRSACDQGSAAVFHLYSPACVGTSGGVQCRRDTVSPTCRMFVGTLNITESRSRFMKRFCLLAGGALAMMSTSAVMAQPQTSTVRDNGFSYDYLQAGYENRDWDGGWETDGIDFKLSHALDEHLFVRGGLQFFD